ncbi:MAG: CpsD/CapB family tyrosine-protein kinase [Ktedonobacteraceae bacterium]|nr:CpsD/CapB family tyrosine-protein kinase [Ktedonobacteraceae bacterium]MBO0792925.1 CpsD/CapB family tyrosine-protein kinase [Ktedonobacteraceae bacterium]
MSTLSHKHIALLSDYEAGSAYAAAYHTLYTNISLDWDRERTCQRTILFTTPMPYPGLATASANVAIAAAQNGTPTILIDANLRAPELQRLFDVAAPGGLYDLLRSQNIDAQAIDVALRATRTPDLHLLCAGEKQPETQELHRLFSTRLTALLDGLRAWLQERESQAGLVMINGPSVLAGVEASLLSARVEQTFLIIAAGRTTRNQARRAQEQLERARAHLAGTVLLDI